MEDPIIPCLPIRELYIVIVWAAVIRLAKPEMGKNGLGCCDSSRMCHVDSEIGKSLPFWATGHRGAGAPKITLFFLFCAY